MIDIKLQVPFTSFDDDDDVDDDDDDAWMLNCTGRQKVAVAMGTPSIVRKFVIE